MFPTASLNDGPYRAVGKVQGVGYSLDATIPVADLLAHATNLSDVFVGERGVLVSLPWLRATRLPVFCMHIGDVVSLRTQEQVSRIAARRVVATVQDEDVRGHRDTMVQFVGDAVSAEPLPERRIPGSDDAIASVIPMSCPWPAVATHADGDLLPEPIFDGCNGTDHAFDIAWGSY